MRDLCVTTEFGKLSDVVLATCENYRVTEPVNITQQEYYTNDPPQLPHLLEEQRAFADLLEASGITIHWAKPIRQCPLQLNTRDIATVIHNTLVIGRMKWPIRRDELDGIQYIVDEINGPILQMPDTGCLEGGDILIHSGTIYIGLGERTDNKGLEFINNKFGEQFEIIPIRLKPKILHLDVAFNILPNTCLIFPDAFVDVAPAFFEKRFENVLIINDTEQFDLATNVFALSPEQVVADKRNRRVTAFLRERRFDVVELEFTHTSRIGGSFRCATLPLVRAEN